MRRKHIYEALHPETRHGENQHTRSRKVCDSSVDRFTADTAAKTGKAERTVQLDVTRGERLTGQAFDAIKGTDLDTGAVLDRVAKEPSAIAQLAAIKRERDQVEARKADKQTDRVIALTTCAAPASARLSWHCLPPPSQQQRGRPRKLDRLDQAFDRGLDGGARRAPEGRERDDNR